MQVLTIVKTKTEHPDLPAKITAAREEAKLSITKCAELCGVSRQYFSSLENNGLGLVSAELIQTIERVLEVKLI